MSSFFRQWLAEQSMLHWFLVSWWSLAAVVGISSFVLTWRVRAADRNAAVLSYLRGTSTGHYRVRTVMAVLPPAVFGALVVSMLLLFVGAVSFLWMAYWTNLLLLNSQIEGVLIGAVIAAFGLSSKVFANIHWQWMRSASIVVRPFFVLLGAAISATSGYAMAADQVFPRVIVEGRIDRAMTVRDRFYGSKYFVVIDGKSYRTTHQVFAPLTVGGQVRAELGAGSRAILHAGW